MSKLQERIEQLEQVKEDIRDRETQGITKGSYLQMLKMHIALLKEIDGLADAITNGNAAYIEDWTKRRCEPSERLKRPTPEEENVDRIKSIVDCSLPTDYCIQIDGLPDFVPTHHKADGNRVILEVTNPQSNKKRVKQEEEAIKFVAKENQNG